MRLIRVTGAALLLTAVLAGPVLAGAPVVADLSVVKTDSPDPVAAGSNITYTITVQNLGPGDCELRQHVRRHSGGHHLRLGR